LSNFVDELSWEMNFTSMFDNFLILFAGVYVLEGFKEILSLIDLPDFQDTVFFSIENEYRLLWFAAAVNSSDIFLYQLVVRHN